jgi:hypothetical protein
VFQTFTSVVGITLLFRDVCPLVIFREFWPQYLEPKTITGINFRIVSLKVAISSAGARRLCELFGLGPSQDMTKVAIDSVRSFHIQALSSESGHHGAGTNINHRESWEGRANRRLQVFSHRVRILTIIRFLIQVVSFRQEAN